MPYCANCGAYIPDGQDACIACGATSAEQNEQAASASAQARKPSGNDDEMHEYLKAQQDKQREENRKWAEQMKAEHDAKQAHTTSQFTGGTPSADVPVAGRRGSKIYAALSYFGILAFLPFLLSPQDEFARFHGKQGILLLVFSIIIDFLSRISGLFSIFYIARLYFVVRGILNVLDNKKQELPYIGKYADKLPL